MQSWCRRCVKTNIFCVMFKEPKTKHLANREVDTGLEHGGQEAQSDL